MDKSYIEKNLYYSILMLKNTFININDINQRQLRHFLKYTYIYSVCYEHILKDFQLLSRNISFSFRIYGTVQLFFHITHSKLNFLGITKCFDCCSILNWNRPRRAIVLSFLSGPYNKRLKAFS